MPDHTLVITDTSCLIVLSRIGSMGLLHRLYRVVVVTDTIADEFGEPLPEWIEVRKVSNTAYQRLLEATLDAGESSAIALAIETPGALLVVDDMKARKEIMRLGLPMTGTLGILFKAKQAGVIPLLAPLLKEVEQAGFRVAPAIIDEMLRRVGEN
jgi:predicted nucleic acid-binding protein